LHNTITVTVTSTATAYNYCNFENNLPADTLTDKKQYDLKKKLNIKNSYEKLLKNKINKCHTAISHIV
jgi:hypothetical protein